MCGIIGTVQYGARLAQADFEHMLDTLAHRGPDGRGVRALDGGAVLLGHRRLAIIDLSADGAQPIGNEDGTVWLTFNGEIYNYRELRNTLIRCGHRFRSRTDSEVIVHAYEEWGTDCVSRLRGIFALGLWDENNKSLFLARDPLGVKPLYYARYGGRLTFASQPKAILADPDFRRDIDPQGLRDFLSFGYVPRACSAFAGMSKLPAGHTATLQGDALRLSCYWRIDTRPDLDDPVEALSRLGEGLADAVSSQLVSDVPVGCFLSGGIDSSLLVALARPHLAELRSFTIGFEEVSSDERGFARLVATHFGTLHQEGLSLERDLPRRLCELQEYFDEPFDPNGPLPFFEVARLARRHNTVVALGGDGADELFAGYLRYDDFDRPTCIRPGLAARLWRGLRRRGLLEARHSTAGDLARYFGYEGCLDDDGLRTLLDTSFLDRCSEGPEAVMRPFYHPDLPAVAAAQHLDMHLYLVDHILCKVDRASMAHGVEARVPFLDPELVRLAFRIPLALHYRRGERKALLKHVARQWLPASVVTERKKGFSSPLGNWFDARSDALLQNWLEDGMLVSLGILRPDWQRRLAALQTERGVAGLRARWLLLTAELWARRWIAGQSLQEATVPGR